MRLGGAIFAIALIAAIIGARRLNAVIDEAFDGMFGDCRTADVLNSAHNNGVNK